MATNCLSYLQNWISEFWQCSQDGHRIREKYCSVSCWAQARAANGGEWMQVGTVIAGQANIRVCLASSKKGSPYSITERRVPELILVLGSQPAFNVSHEPGGRLPLLFARPAVTLATLKRAATNFAAWWTEAQWVWTVCLRLLPDTIVTAIWTWALLRLSPAR